jgi:ELWxxDGT repeat protein
MQLIGSLPPERRIVRMVGSGGMGVVYEAWDTRLERRVALKALHPHLTLAAQTRDLLLKEARLAARVEHEGVVRIYTIHEAEDGLCLEMQFVEGIPLSQLLVGGRLTPAHAVDLLRQILEALAACHQQKVVHCDLKPGNLLVTEDGKVLLADFGISRAVFSNDEAVLPTSSLSGATWGTPQYCPPEAWEGESPTPAWDLYALGVLAYEALAGDPPFEGRTPALLMREKLDGNRVSIGKKCKDISKELAGLIDSLQSPLSGERPASATEALEILSGVPEYADAVSSTSPFQHSEAPTIEGLPIMSNSEGMPTGPRISSPTELGSLGSGWKLHLVWIGILTTVIALLYGMYPRPKEPDITPAVAMIEADGKLGDVQDLYVENGRAFFSYDDGSIGRELWVADGDAKLEPVRDINPGRGSSNPRYHVVDREGRILFSAVTQENGREPWIVGSAPPYAPRILEDLVPGPMYSAPQPVGTWGNLFYFFAATIDSGNALWVTDGHHERTGLVSDINPDIKQLDSIRKVVHIDASGIYFKTNGGQTWLLMHFAFADAEVTTLGGINRDIGDMAVLGEKRVFAMNHEDRGTELWIYDASDGEIRLLKDIRPGTGSSNPVEFFVWKDEVYFRAWSVGRKTELWKTDGTERGTVLVADIQIGPGDSSPCCFVPSGDHLFFRAVNATYGTELWATDGTVGKMPRVFDVMTGNDSSHPYSAAAIGKFLLFSADDGAHGEELWAVDSSDPDLPLRRVEDILPGKEGSEPHSLTKITESEGVFVYKKNGRDAIMRIKIIGDDFELMPYPELPIQLPKN